MVPDGKTRGRREPPPLRRAVASVVLAAWIALALVFGSSPDYLRRRVEQLAADHVWSAVDWEARHLPGGLWTVLGQAVWPSSPEEVRNELLLLFAGEKTLADHDAVRLMAAAVTEQLRLAGVRSVGGAVIPPVSFTVSEPPAVLIISPRSEIRLAEAVLLREDIDLESAASVEMAAERLNVSALVEQTGGLATYPTLITPGSGAYAALQTIAHEWTHTALFLTPLGRAYGTSGEARAINETLADLVGQEVAERAAAAAGYQPRRASARPDQGLIDHLRRVRVQVDELLARGEVEGAEAYMEEERQALVARGYGIRRLNQAYFAFHGNYAEGPAASTEIPDALRDLRAGSPTLADFIGTAGGVTSLAELRTVAGRAAPAEPDETRSTREPG